MFCLGIDGYLDTLDTLDNCVCTVSGVKIRPFSSLPHIVVVVIRLYLADFE